MTAAEILQKAGFRESPDGQWRYHVGQRKAFNAETQRDATSQWIQKCLAEPVAEGAFEFYFWTRGSEDMMGCKSLLSQLRRNNDMIVVKYGPR
jgi:hypothetical protein